MKIASFRVISILVATFALSACGGATPTAVPAKAAQAVADSKFAPKPTVTNAVGAQASPIATESQVTIPAEPTAIPPTDAPVAAAREAGGEGGGGEVPLVTYADTGQGFSIDYPKPWTKDLAVKDGVKFDGEGTMSLAFVKADVKDVLAFATADTKTFATSLPAFSQVGLAASTEVQNAVVLGFETTGISNVTGKTYKARGDRYYIGLKDGRITVLTFISPVKNYDREGIRDIALTLKVMK